jgi:hypothetical protein
LNDKKETLAAKDICVNELCTEEIVLPLQRIPELQSSGDSILEPFCAEATESWKEVLIRVEVSELIRKGVKINEIKGVGVAIVGKDQEFWAGHFGARFRKFSLLEVTFDEKRRISNFIKVWHHSFGIKV